MFQGVKLMDGFRGTTGKLQSGGSVDRCGRRSCLGMNRDGSRAQLERGVKGVYIGQDDQQQYDQGRAAKDDQTRRLNSPPRHSS